MTTHSNDHQLFVVQPNEQSNVKVVLWANGREDAKRKANAGWLSNTPVQFGGVMDPDKFIVTPISNPGDRVKLEIVLNV